MLQQFDTGNWWIEITAIVTLVWQANRLNKCASHPKVYYYTYIYIYIYISLLLCYYHHIRIYIITYYYKFWVLSIYHNNLPQNLVKRTYCFLTSWFTKMETNYRWIYITQNVVIWNNIFLLIPTILKLLY